MKAYPDGLGLSTSELQRQKKTQAEKQSFKDELGAVEMSKHLNESASYPHAKTGKGATYGFDGIGLDRPVVIGRLRGDASRALEASLTEGGE